jgi:hypothetical protein
MRSDIIDIVVPLLIMYESFEAIVLTGTSPINACLALHGITYCTHEEVGMMALLAWNLLVTNTLTGFLWYESKDKEDNVRSLRAFVQYILIAKMSAAVVTGRASKGGIIVDSIYLLDLAFKLSLVIMGCVSLRRQTIRTFTTNPLMPRDPSSQAIILFNAMKTWTFFELVLRGNMPSINESAPTMITYFYENRITLSAMISLVLGVLAASYASKKCQRNFCAVVGACYVAEEAIGRLTFLSGQVTFTHV